MNQRVQLKRICRWTNQPYPPDVDTKAQRWIWDMRMTPISAVLDGLNDAALTWGPTAPHWTIEVGDA